MKTRTSTVLHALCAAISARLNCEKSGNADWFARHSDSIDQLANFLPRGSGFDSGTKIDLDRSDGRSKVVLTTSFHHMNQNGMYDGWTEHTVIVRPCLLFGFRLSISGKDRNQIKEYMHETFSHALREEVTQDAQGEFTLARYAKVATV